MKTSSIKIKELSLKNGVSQNYLKWMNDREVVKYLESGKSKIEKEDLQKYVQKKKKSIKEFLFGIYFKNSHIGNIKLGPIDLRKKIAQIGYIIGVKKFQNRGFASQAINKIFNISFKKKKIKKILANSEKDNFASIKALKKNGFKVKNFKVVKRKLKKKKLIYFYIDKKTWLMNQDKYKIFGVRNLGVRK
jgi:ribosomal-protein-alanine N-acetyltransferase